MSTSAEEKLEYSLKYRAEQSALWKILQKKRDEYVSRARQHGAPDETALEAAGRYIRGEVRVFVDHLLLHLREQHAGAFVKAAPREWGYRTELLLDADPLVPSYIGESFPVAAWAVQLDAAEREAIQLARAERNADWGPWLMKRMERMGEVGAGAVEHVFGAVGDIGTGIGTGIGEIGTGIGEGIGGIGQGVGEGIGGVGKGVGEGAGAAGKGLGDTLRIAGGVLAVGVVVIGGIWLFGRASS